MPALCESAKSVDHFVLSLLRVLASGPSLGIGDRGSAFFSSTDMRYNGGGPSGGGGEVTMSIRFSCAQCGKAFAVGEQFAGKRVKCNECGAALTIPAATAAPVA